MTDVEMNLSHKDKDIKTRISKFDDDKSDDSLNGLLETDPLALDEEKMDIGECEKDGTSDSQDLIINGSNEECKVNTFKEVLLDNGKVTGKDEPLDFKETENKEESTLSISIDDKSDCNSESITENLVSTIPTPSSTTTLVKDDSIISKPLCENIITEIEKEVTKPDNEVGGELLPMEPILKNTIETPTEKKSDEPNIKISAEVQIKEELPIKTDNVDQKPTEEIKIKNEIEHIQKTEGTPNLNGEAVSEATKEAEKPIDYPADDFVPDIEEHFYKQENCSSGESEIDEPPMQIVEDEPAKSNGVNKRPNENKSEDCPSKKLCLQLQETFEKHNSIVSEYISNSSNINIDEVSRHTETLITEIETLRDLAQSKELEWNNILHLKKVKEEILLRLLRKKKTMMFEKLDANTPEKEREAAFQQFLSSKNFVEDKHDEAAGSLEHKSTPSMHLNSLQMNSGGLVLMPVSSVYNPVSLANLTSMDNRPDYYGNKKIVPKPMGILPRHPMSNFQFPDMNGQLGYNMPMGRHGPIKDVQSIIADYRQRHPKAAPRRGRRMKPILNQQSPQMALGPRPMVPHPNVSEPSMADLGLLLGGVEGNHHMSSMETARQNLMLGQPAGGAHEGMSFKDVLVQFAGLAGAPPTRLPPPPPYPEVTLHPVGGINVGHIPPPKPQQSNSLLHGILTKSQPRQDSRFSTFSPTLARLLTAPEKILPPANVSNTATMVTTSSNYATPKQSCSEITITPVQSANQVNNRHQQEIVQLDDFEEAEAEEDSAERPLVIDEGARSGEGAGAVEMSENEVPECQGCRRREAQFVCAGCANQWYCSRECQVSAWDEHSEVCSG